MLLLLKRRQLIVSIDVCTNDHRRWTSSPQADREMQPSKKKKLSFSATVSQHFRVWAAPTNKFDKAPVVEYKMVLSGDLNNGNI